MKSNVGQTDRIVRGGVAVVAAVLAAVVGLGSLGGIILAVVAVIMAVTAAVGTCPIYSVLGVSTCPVADD